MGVGRARREAWVIGFAALMSACSPSEIPLGSETRRTTAEALTVTDEAVLTRRVGVPADLYGRTLDLSGDELLVGAPGEPDVLPNQGSVYAYFREGGIWEWTDRQRLVAPDGAEGDAFGAAVAIDGTTALVGAPGDDGAGPDSGSVYLFTRASDTYTVPWAFVTKLAAADAAAGDRFGAAVSLRGDLAIIGAPGKSTARGFAYVFARNGSGSWGEQQKLGATTPAADDAFGKAVALDGTTAIVGAPGRDGAGTDAGAAFIFAQSGSTWVQQHVNAGTRAGGMRGTAVALLGNMAFVGAPHERSDDHGAVSVLGRSGASWTQSQELTAPDAVAGDGFGRTIDAETDRLLVGAPDRVVDGMSQHGTVYAFDLVGSTWNPSAQLAYPGDGAAGDELGAAVAISGDYAATAMPGREGEGRVYIWQRLSGWAYDRLVSRTASMINDSMGIAVAVDGNRVVLGAPGYSTGAVEYGSGGALVFERSGTSWPHTATLQAADPQSEESFGRAVVVQGDLIAASVPGDQVGGDPDQGSIRIFERNGPGWSETATLTASHRGGRAFLGQAMAISGNTLAAGAPGHAHTLAVGTTGAVFVFVRNGSTWQEQAELLASDGRNTDNLGTSVAIEGDLLVSGSPSADVTQGEEGAAYIFERSGQVWSQAARLNDPTPGFRRWFGDAVAIAGQQVFVAASGSTGGGILPAGAVSVFRRSGSSWTLAQTLKAPNSDVGDQFGRRLAASAGLVAAIDLQTVSPYQPELHFFELAGQSWQYASTKTPEHFAYGGLVIDDDLVVLGAHPADILVGSDAGAAYVYRTTAACGGTGGTCCTTDSACAAGEYCNAAGRCAPSRSNGQSCNPNADCYVPATCALCQSGHCVDGVCCDGACSDACETCAGAASAGPAGTCSPVVDGTLPTPACSARTVCDGVSRTCPTDCSINADCQSGAVCIGNRCVDPLGQGTPCTDRAHCASGHCVDGVCCDSACSGTCQACTAALKNDSSADGSCGNARAGLDPRDHCAVEDPSTCGTTGYCDGAGACSFHGPTAACGSTTCEDNRQRGRVCTSPNVCGNSTEGVDCFPYRCEGDRCGTGCTTNADCASPSHVCVAGLCVPGRGPGDPCALVAECLSSFCADGVCCDSACAGQCEACTEAGHAGTCTPVSGSPRNHRAACQGSGPCAGSCNGIERTTCVYPDSATACGAPSCDGNTLVSASSCDGSGQCRAADRTDCAPHVCAPAQNACKNPCESDADCVPGFVCSTGACVPKGSSCKDAVTAVTADGKETPCAPYRCVNGTCGTGCAAEGDCAPGFACRTGVCAKLEPNPPEVPPAGEDGDCGCRAVGSRGRNGAWLIVVCSLIALLPRRRRSWSSRELKTPAAGPG